MPGYINIISNFPLRWLCSPEDRDRFCQVVIRPVLPQGKQDIQCAKDGHVIQAVFGMKKMPVDKDAFCRYPLDTVSLNTSLQIPVQGTIDGLLDKNQKRKIDIIAEVLINKVIESSENIGQVDVRYPLLLLLSLSFFPF